MNAYSSCFRNKNCVEVVSRAKIRNEMQLILVMKRGVFVEHYTIEIELNVGDD